MSYLGKHLKATIIALTVLSMIVFPGIRTGIADSSQPNTILRMTIPVPPNSLNALTTVSSTSGYTIEPLEYLSTPPILFPNGTQDWAESATDAIVHNSNYTQWILHAKPGLRWSDGTNLTAADILATFSPNFALNSTYDIWGLGSEIQKEFALNTSTAVFDLNVTDAHFIDKINLQTYVPLYPASFVNKQGASSSDLGTDVGLGPFYVSNYTEGSFLMKMLRNPYYVPQPAISEIDINFVDSLSLTSTNMLAGTSDLAPLEPSNAAAILKDPSLGIIDQKGWDITTLEYNDSMYPYNMTNFRQALAYAINQTQFISQADSGFGVPAYDQEGLERSTATAWFNPNIQKYNFNQSMALSLLSNAGIQKGADGKLHYQNGTIVSLGLWTDTDNTADVVGASVIKQDLENLGFNVNVVTTSASNLVSDFTSGTEGANTAMVLFTSIALVPGMPFIEAFPAWNTVWLPTVHNPYWEYPPSADAEYQSNYTAFIATDNYTLEHEYFSNIQSLNAQYLPTLVVAYPDYLWVYSKAHWTNWPTGDIIFNGPWNNTTFENLKPVGQTTTTTITTVPATSSSTISTSITTTASSSVQQTTTTTFSSSSSSTTNSSNSSLVIPAAIVIVVVVVLATIGIYAARRRRL